MNKNGIALIMAVGVLALLAIIATGFALNMRLEYHAAMNYYSGVKARYFAEAALQRAIAELKTHVKSSAFDDLTEAWSLAGYSNNSMLIADKSAGRINSSGTSATTHVYDEQSKVNINTANALLLSNLVSRVFSSWSNGAVNTFVTKITDHIPCNNLNELRIDTDASASDNSIGKTDLDTLMPFITVNSYRDPNCGNRAPININTCSQAALESIFDGLKGIVGAAVNAGKAAGIASAVISARSITPITSWSSFDSVIDTVAVITVAQRAAIKDNCNPNRTKPTPSTTEFCFNSGGYYTVTATGSVTGALSAPIASNTLSAVVKVYDIYCETKVKDSSGNPVQFALGTPERVTWLDSCPIRSDQIFSIYQIHSDAEKIEGSIKLGFWDDFNADADGGDRAYSKKHWKRNLNTFALDSDFNNGRLITMGGVRFDLYGPDDGMGWGYWTWGDFNMRVHATESGGATSMKQGAWVFFRKANGGIPYTGHPGVFHSSGGNLLWEDSTRFAYANLWSSPAQSVFLTPNEAFQRKNQYGVFADVAAATAGKYSYPAQIRIATAYKQGSVPGPNPTPASGWPCDENSDSSNSDLNKNYKTDLMASNDKTFIITGNGNNITLDVWINQSTHAVLNRILASPYNVINRNGTTTQVSMSTSGRMVLYGWDVNIEWDDIRVISKDGNFESQVIDPTPAISGDVLVWGTIASTVTIPSTASALSETVALATSTNGWSSTEAVPISLSINSAKSATIQYCATFNSTNSQQETPVLEDVTITYLPKISIKSFSLSN